MRIETSHQNRLPRIDLSRIPTNELKRLMDHAVNGIIDSDKIDDPELLGIMKKINDQQLVKFS